MNVLLVKPLCQLAIAHCIIANFDYYKEPLSFANYLLVKLAI